MLFTLTVIVVVLLLFIRAMRRDFLRGRGRKRRGCVEYRFMKITTRDIVGTGYVDKDKRIAELESEVRRLKATISDLMAMIQSLETHFLS